MAAGPWRAPCWCEVVRSRGTGKITAREVSYREYSSGIPQKFSGGIGVYRLMVGLCVLGKYPVRRLPAPSALSTLPAGERDGKRIRLERFASDTSGRGTGAASGYSSRAYPRSPTGIR